MRPFMALLRHADSIERCPFSDVTRKTFAPTEFFSWSVCAPGHHGYPRAPDLILRKALRGRLGHQITGATARPFLHFLHPTRRPRQVSVASETSVGHPLGGFEHVDPMRLLARRALRSCDLVPTQSKRSAPAYWRVRLPGRYGVSVVPQP